MADDDTLIASLRAGGENRGSGAFTLDPVKAREKLREFQLADPHRYVLLLVQAMAMRGATRIDVLVDTDDMRMTSDAAPFTLEELSELYLLLFSDAPPPPGLREFALAMNAAMATDPRWVRVECSGPAGGKGVRLEQRNETADRVEAVDGLEAGMCVHVRERFRLGLIRRFFAAGSNVIREQILLLHHCGYANIPIRLGGALIPARNPAEDVDTWRPIELDGRPVGRLGLSASGERGRLELIRHHVWMTEHAFDHPDFAGVRGVLDVSELRTDASLVEVVRDAAWARLMVAVADARDLALAAAARQYPGGNGPFASPLRELLCRRIAAHLDTPTPRLDQEPLRDWLAVVLWFTIGDDRRTTGQLLGKPNVRWSSVAMPSPPPELAEVVFADGHAAQLLAAVFGARLLDVTADVRRTITLEANRKAFEERLHAVLLPSGQRYEHMRRFEQPDVVGVIGFAPNAGPSWVRIISDNRLLVELPFSPPMTTIHVVVSAPFRPTAIYDDVQRDDAFAKAMYAMLVAMSELVRDVCTSLLSARTFPQLVLEDLVRYVLAATNGTHGAEMLASLGLSETRNISLRAELGEPWRFEGGEALLGEGAHPFVALPIFTDAAERPVDLSRVAATVRDDGFVRVITTGRPPLLEPPMFVVRVGALRLALLEALFGAKQIKRVGSEYEKWLARETLLRGTERIPLQIDGRYALGPLEFKHVDRPGIIGLLEDESETTRFQTPVRIFVDGRPLTTLRCTATLRGVTAALDMHERWLNGACDGLVPAGVAAAEAMLAGGLAALVDRLLAQTGVLPHRLRAAALDAVAHACPGSGYMRTWMALHLAPDIEARIDRYTALLAIGDTREPAALLDALLSQLARQQTPSFETTSNLLRVKRTESSTWSTTRVVVARRLPQLLALPLIRTCGGAWLSLASVIEAIETSGKFGYLVAPGEVPPAFAVVADLDGTTLSALTNLFGASQLRDRASDLKAALRRVEFERRQQLDELALPPADTLASIIVEFDGVHGVIGVGRATPTAAQGKVTITNDRRVVAEIEPVPGTPWLGILDGEAFGQEMDYEDVTPREIEHIAGIFDSHRPMIISALCDAGLTGEDGDLRRAWVQHLLRTLLPLAGREQASLDHAGVAEVGTVPLFVDAQGVPRTLTELRGWHDEHGSLAVVRLAGLQTDRPLVLMRDGIEHALLRHLFGQLEDAEPVAERRAAFATRVASAPPLPSPPDDAFVVDVLDGRGLTGALWLSPAVTVSSTIDLGIDGRSLTQWQGSRMFPCAGGVSGEGVQIADDFTGCELSRARQDYLKGRASRLYVQLVTSMKDRFGHPDDPRCALLLELLLRLHEIHRENRKWPSHDMRRLYRDLKDAPLLPLASGRAISLRAALKTRPPELATIGPDGGAPWSTGDGPVDDADDTDAPPDADADSDSGSDGTQTAPGPSAEQRDAPAAVEDAVAPTAPIAEPPPPPPAPEVVEAPPPPPSPQQILRDRIVGELRLLHQRDMSLLTEVHLDMIDVDQRDGARVAIHDAPRLVVDSAHPVVRAALGPDVDPLLVSLVASATLTALNAALEAFVDADEARLLQLHAEHLSTTPTPGWGPPLG